MPRYHFNIHSPADFIRDDEGTEAADPEQARSYAEGSAREMMADAVRRGRPVVGESFFVTDERGELVFSYPFRNALKLN